MDFSEDSISDGDEHNKSTPKLRFVDPDDTTSERYSVGLDVENGTGRKLSKNAVRKRSREFAHRQCRIILRNISYNITAKKLRSEFEEFGTLEEVNILKRPDGRLVGCAFLQYSKREESDRAIAAMDGHIFMGRKLQVCYALHKDMYTKMKDVEMKTEVKSEDDIEETKVEEDSDNDSTLKLELDRDTVENAKFKDSNELDIKSDKLARQKNHKEIEEGRTVFLKHVPYDADESALKDVMSQFGTVEKVLINKERISGHSKGTAFVIFKLKDSAEMSKKQSLKLQVNNTFIEIVEALKKKVIREKEKLAKDKLGKDSRNLYLLKEGLIMAGSPAAKGVSKTDMAQRLRLEQRAAQMLKNLNRFVSRDRLTLHNLPENYTNIDLRKAIQQHTGYNPQECRIMRENYPSFGNPAGKSRGYGFLSFKKHEIALEVLRKLNNNPSVFGKSSRPIVAFSIEDRKVHNIKQQRLMKSRLNNPTYQQKLEKIRAKKKDKLLKKEKQKDVLQQSTVFANQQMSSSKKLSTKERKRKIYENTLEFTGEISRPGKMGIRSNKKIHTQAEAHMARLKTEKKEARKKRVKQEQQRNRQLKASRRVKPKHTNVAELKREDQYFQQTVGKFKQIINQATEKDTRKKWYVE